MDKHFSLANRDLKEVKLSADKVTGRADKFDSLSFEELSISEVDKVKDQRSKLNVINS